MRHAWESRTSYLSYELGEPSHVEDPDAYAVIAGTLTVTMKGQTVAQTGTLGATYTVAFRKHGDELEDSTPRRGREARQVKH